MVLDVGLFGVSLQTGWFGVFKKKIRGGGGGGGGKVDHTSLVVHLPIFALPFW